MHILIYVRSFFETKLLLKDLIKKYFKNKFSTFYYWANKILLAYANNNFEDLLLKSTIPNNINYQYSNDVRENICDLYFEYCNKHGNVTNKDNEDATITFNLSRAAIDKKLANWGKIIIQFIKYAKGGTFISSFVEFRFPNKTF